MKLDTAELILEWARKTWPCDNPECRDSDNCVTDTATAERLAMGQRLLAIVEHKAQAYACKSCHVPPFVGDCTCAEAEMFHYIIAEAAHKEDK